MKLISKSRILGFMIFFLPILAINSILVLSQSFEFREKPVKGNYYKDIKIYNAGDGLRDKQELRYIGYAIPYIDGTTSISRLGRVFPNWLIFKPLMIFTGLLLCFFWNYQKQIFEKRFPKNKYINKFNIFGILCGITLIFHTIFLGFKFDNNIYKFMFRFNLAFCVLMAILCKYYFVVFIKHYSNNDQKFKNVYFKIQYFLTYFLIFILFMSMSLPFFDKSKILIQIVEWNYFILIFTFYLLNTLGLKNYSVIHPPPRTLSPN